MVVTNPDSIAALIDLAERKFPNAFVRVWASMSDAEFDDAFESMLEGAVDHLEKNANFYYDDDEDKITAAFVAYLSMPGLRVLQQSHSKGHVDITVELERMPPLRRRLGEAKIYGGPAYHEKGLQQLVKRYTTGREGFGILLEYVQVPGIKQLVAKIREYMDINKPCEQNGQTENHRFRWAFVTHHLHSSGELLRVVHLSCNLNR